MINFLEYLYSPRGIYTTSLRVVSLHRRKHLFLSFPLEKIRVAFKRGRWKRRGEKGVRSGHIFREQGWPRGNFATRVFPQDLCPPSPQRLTMSLASYTRLLSRLPPSRFPVSSLPKLSSPITGVWPFFGIRLYENSSLLSCWIHLFHATYVYPLPLFSSPR